MLIRPSAKKDLEVIGNLKNSALVYSLWNGYLKENYTADFVKWLESEGVEKYNVHTSGHADVETLKDTIEEIAPVFVVPIHTFVPDVYRELYGNVQTAEDGILFSI
jgi:ribonuclease J